MDGAARMLWRNGHKAPGNALVAAQSRVAQLRSQLRQVRARYDAAQTNSENRKHWAGADGLSANAANSAAVRKTLRERARYEVGCNSYAQGIALTLANDTIGTGPRLQMLTDSERDNDLVEALFTEWAEEINLAGKLRTMRLAKFQDGEGFGLLTTNPRLRNKVKLDVRLIEAERVASPFGPTFSQPVDGMVLDAAGNPVSYEVLQQHPGDAHPTASFKADLWPARLVLHYFTPLRPEQARGIPELTSAMPLFAQLRRYTLAVIAAAEVAADHAAVIESDGPVNEEGAVSPEAMDTIELEPRMATVLPQGWKIGQIKAEQPTTTYSQFKAEVIGELARCLNVPFNVAAGNSSGYNYASGRLDFQVYFRSLRVEQSEIERAVLERIFDAWIAEAVLVEGFLPQSFRRVRKLAHQWFWDGNEHVDPEKEANAQETRLRNGTTNRAEEYGRRGRDWRAEGKQLLAEKMAELQDKAALLEEARRLGLPDSVVIEQAPAAKPAPKPAAQPQEEPANAA